MILQILANAAGEAAPRERLDARVPDGWRRLLQTPWFVRRAELRNASVHFGPAQTADA
jgi:hypothetical protein